MNYADREQLMLFKDYTLKKINTKIANLEKTALHVEDKICKYNIKMDIEKLKRKRKIFTGEILE